jgi:hypothetical protein
MRRKWRDINRSSDALSTKLATVFAVARRQDIGVVFAFFVLHAFTVAVMASEATADKDGVGLFLTDA